MQMFVETIIYLVAIMGIIFSTMSIFEICLYKKPCKNTYKLYKLKNDKKRISMMLKFENIEKEEKEEILNKIKNGEYDNIEDIIDDIHILE